MPKMNDRKAIDRVNTFLALPRTTREGLEAAIGHKDIKSLTDAVVEAEKLLAKQVKKSKPTKPN